MAKYFSEGICEFLVEVDDKIGDDIEVEMRASIQLEHLQQSLHHPRVLHLAAVKVWLI